MNGRWTALILIFISIVLSLAVATTAAVFYQMYRAVNVMNITNIEVLTPRVIAGEKATIRFTVDKFIDCPIMIQRTLIDGIPVIYAEEPGIQPLGNSIKTIEVLIPKDHKSGWVHIQSTVKVRVNYFRVWYKTWQSPLFYVVVPSEEMSANINAIRKATEKLKVLQQTIGTMEQSIEKNNIKLKRMKVPAEKKSWEGPEWREGGKR